MTPAAPIDITGTFISAVSHLGLTRPPSPGGAPDPASRTPESPAPPADHPLQGV